MLTKKNNCVYVVPLWYEAACIYPPRQMMCRGRTPDPLPLPDLRVRRELMRRHPELSTPVRLHSRSRGYVPLADRWVDKQMAMLAKGMEWDESWRVMESEYQSFLYRDAVQRGVAARAAEQRGRRRGGVQQDKLNAETRVALVKQEERRTTQLAAALDKLITDRQAANDPTLISNDEFAELGVSYRDKLAYYRANPWARAYFDEHLEIEDFSQWDLSHPELANLDPLDADAVHAAYLRYDADVNVIGEPEDDSIDRTPRRHVRRRLLPYLSIFISFRF
jgi:hypothetical protein